MLASHKPWTLDEGTIECILLAMSVLALLGVRYPIRMLPILLFELAWKITWLAIVALPLWPDNKLEGPTRTQTGAVLCVVIIVAVIPWCHVFTRYLTHLAHTGAADQATLTASPPPTRGVGADSGNRRSGGDGRPG